MERQFAGNTGFVARLILPSVLTALLGACATAPKESAPTPAISGTCPTTPACAPCGAGMVCVPETKPAAAPLKPTQWSDLPGWANNDAALSLTVFKASCNAISQQPRWRAACTAARSLAAPDKDQARAFFEQNFQPFQVVNPDATTEGTITGYYEPLLNGSRTKKAPYLYPLYAQPDDLLIVDLASVEPALKGLRLRGRLQGNRVVPYLTRAEIEDPKSPLKGKELFYVDDDVEAFFLEIQGSGRLHLDTGETVRVAYAEQNGHPYQSIGRYLVQTGELKLEQASMQGIKAWGRAHPDKLQALLNHNPSYVFFKESREQGEGPIGALGVPLTPGSSIAVDPRVIPMGSPVYLATTMPNSTEPLNRLVFAQDTGGAIRGAVRADFFWGFGPDAGQLAGRMRQKGSMWVLLPPEVEPAEKR